MPDLPPDNPPSGRRTQVFLLRMWCETEGAPWRLAVRASDDDEAIGLADLDELVVFLLRRMAGDGQQESDDL